MFDIQTFQILKQVPWHRICELHLLGLPVFVEDLPIRKMTCIQTGQSMSRDVALCGSEADDVLDENWDFPLGEPALVGLC